MKTLKIIIPCYNEEKNLHNLYLAIDKSLKGIAINWETVMVDDGSRDKTWDKIIELSDEYSNIKGIQLSRNFGKENALQAGIFECGEADFYLTMDADLQDDPSLIPQMLESIIQNNHDIVYAQRNKRYESKFYQIFIKLFYYIMTKSTNGAFPQNVADYYIFNNNVRNAYMQLGEKVRYNRGLIFLVGFDRGSVFYERKERAEGNSSFNYLKLIVFAIKSIVSFSTFPIHVITILGFIGSFLSLFVGITYVVYSMISGFVQVSGWISLTLFIVFFGSFQTAMLGIIGQYIAMNTVENKSRPTYFVKCKI